MVISQNWSEYCQLGPVSKKQLIDTFLGSAKSDCRTIEEKEKKKKQQRTQITANQSCLPFVPSSLLSPLNGGSQTGHLRGLDVDVGATAALVTLGRDDLVVVLAQVEAVASPSLEVVVHVDGAADTLVLANGPVLLEGPGAVDRGLVGTGRDVDVVDAAVGREAALELGAGGGVVGAAVEGL